MAKDFTEQFVNLRGLGFRTNAFAKLCLNHAERGFDV